MNLDSLLSIEPFTWRGLATALACGVIVGLERQLRGKPVGIRTSSLIVLGTYIFVAISIHVSNDVSDPSRIIGQVITGIGFLGAGVMLSKDGTVVGVTSAATIWALASIGVCIAIGSLLTSIKLALVVVVILIGVDLLESYSAAFTRGVHARYTVRRNRSKKNGVEQKVMPSDG